MDRFKFWRRRIQFTHEVYMAALDWNLMQIRAALASKQYDKLLRYSHTNVLISERLKARHKR